MTTSTPARPKSKTFHLTATKIAVLKALAEYFCLSVKDLCILVYGKHTDSNETSVNRTLNLLEAERLSDWRKYVTHIRKVGNPPLVYGLTDKGVAKVAEEGLATRSTKVFKPNSDLMPPHEYEITQFHLALQQLCTAQNYKLYWQQADLKCSVNPDALFGITTDKGTFWYFLEIEKTKPGAWRNGESKIIRNLGKYFKYFNTDLCEKEWANFRKFRVVIVQRNDERRRNLLKQLAPMYPNRMFWLTTEELYRQGIDEEIFKTPKDYEKVAYSFLQ